MVNTRVVHWWCLFGGSDDCSNAFLAHLYYSKQYSIKLAQVLLFASFFLLCMYQRWYHALRPTLNNPLPSVRGWEVLFTRFAAWFLLIDKQALVTVDKKQKVFSWFVFLKKLRKRNAKCLRSVRLFSLAFAKF